MRWSYECICIDKRGDGDGREYQRSIDFHFDGASRCFDSGGCVDRGDGRGSRVEGAMCILGLMFDVWWMCTFGYLNFSEELSCAREIFEAKRTKGSRANNTNSYFHNMQGCAVVHVRGISSVGRARA
jgi:hypothetical protein